MYFEVKAFKGNVRRFENLDSFGELEDFCAKYSELNFRKMIVRAFDCEGFRSVSYFTFEEGTYRRLKIIRERV